MAFEVKNADGRRITREMQEFLNKLRDNFKLCQRVWGDTKNNLIVVVGGDWNTHHTIAWVASQRIHFIVDAKRCPDPQSVITPTSNLNMVKFLFCHELGHEYTAPEGVIPEFVTLMIVREKLSRHFPDQAKPEVVDILVNGFLMQRPQVREYLGISGSDLVKAGYDIDWESRTPPRPPAGGIYTQHTYWMWYYYHKFKGTPVPLPSRMNRLAREIERMLDTIFQKNMLVPKWVDDFYPLYIELLEKYSESMAGRLWD